MATRKFHKFGELRDLPGRKRKATPGWRASGPTDAIRVLRAKGLATAAGDEGAITVYRDDDGKFRCEFDRYKFALSTEIFASIAKVRAWLKEWWPAMRRE